jgi:hypothetical protein
VGKPYETVRVKSGGGTFTVTVTAEELLALKTLSPE